MGGGSVDNDTLVILAAVASVQLSKGLTAEQLGLLAAFFTCLGDNLALLALGSSSNCDPSCTTNEGR